MLKSSSQDYYSNVCDVTNSITEIPEAGGQLLGWQLTLHLYVWQDVQVWGHSCTGDILTQCWIKLRVSAEEHQQTITRD